MTRPLLYVAGPYTADPVVCSRAAIVTATAIYKHTAFVPVVPHLSLFWHSITPMPYEDWLNIDLAILSRCHGIVRLPGESPGADREVNHAEAIGIPLIPFDSMSQVVRDAYRHAMGVLA